MQIILLSGGSGTRLWPLSNDARSKQFLRLFPTEGSNKPESMVQRVVRQILEAGLEGEITVATGENQKDYIKAQLGDRINLVTEPSRRDTFPAICLACEYLSKVKKCSDSEPVVVMPCDPFTEPSFFDKIKEMAKGVEKGLFQLILMGISPDYPSSKYGYIMPESRKDGKNFPEFIFPVLKFIEKPDQDLARQLISEGALWNGGVFSFRLGFMTEISSHYQSHDNFEEYVKNYSLYPKISFDYEVAEKARSLGVIRFEGNWKDLGTWNSLAENLEHNSFGAVQIDRKTANTHIINELEIPVLAMGLKDIVIAATPDGILVAAKSETENIRNYADRIKSRPMQEERRWGHYKVIDHTEYRDGFQSLTKRLTLIPGGAISYQRHSHRDEVWTFIDGEGEIVTEGKRKRVARGEVVVIPKGTLHALRAITQLTFIEVQHGTNLVEEDIERFPFDW